MHLVRPRVIIAIDGGICSHMIAYLRGVYYSEKGLNVSYDLHWYKVSGKDVNGQSDRPFELQTM